MKTLISLFSALILVGFSVNAETKSSRIINTSNQNSFIFIENGIEFSVFRDGQFDFNIVNNNRHFNTSVNTSNVSISFNNGYDYNPYLQFDEFGAIIQIENTPVYYDYYGRVNQVGNINIFYNNFGFISRVGGLHVHYNRFNAFSHYTGFINTYNRSYVYRPWHNYYIAPSINHCVVFNRPYRQFYTPVRYVYSTPFYNNYRPVSAVYSRQGDVIVRNRYYATANRSSRNITQINYANSSRRNLDYNNSAQKNYNTAVSRNSRSDYNTNNTQKTSTNRATSNSSRRSDNQNTVNRERNTRTSQSQPIATQQRSNTRTNEAYRTTTVKDRNTRSNNTQSTSTRRRI